MSANRVSTGIRKLDEKIGGGFLNGQSVLVCGESGSGKTILSLQFLHHAATNERENGVHVSFDNPASQIRLEGNEFGWNLRRLEDENRLCLLDKSPFGEATNPDASNGLEADALAIEILRECRRIGAKRVVLDGLNGFVHAFENRFSGQRSFGLLLKTLKRNGLTVIATSHVERNESESACGIEPFLLDGIIRLERGRPGTSRRLSIQKMRQTRHENKAYKFGFNETGIDLIE